MKDPISSLLKDSKGLGNKILNSLAVEPGHLDTALAMGDALILALADSIKMMHPSTFLNSIELWAKTGLACDGASSLVHAFVLKLEEIVMEWDLLSRQTRFLWSLFNNARSQLTKEEDRVSAVRQSDPETFLADIADRIPGFIYQFYAQPNGTMGLSYISGRSLDIFGFDPELSDIFEFFVSQLTPSCRDRFLESINRAIAGETDWEFEGEYIKPSGESMFFVARSRPVRMGDTLQFNGVLLDITEKRLAEEKFKESERKFKVIADLLPR